MEINQIVKMFIYTFDNYSSQSNNDGDHFWLVANTQKY